MKSIIILGDVVYFDVRKICYQAIPSESLMDKLNASVPLFLVTRTGDESFLIKQINPETETMATAAGTMTEVETSNP